MRRHHQTIRDSWATVVLRAILLHDADAAYRLTVAFVRRLRALDADPRLRLGV